MAQIIVWCNKLKTFNKVDDNLTAEIVEFSVDRLETHLCMVLDKCVFKLKWGHVINHKTNT